MPVLPTSSTPRGAYSGGGEFHMKYRIDPEEDLVTVFMSQKYAPANKYCRTTTGRRLPGAQPLNGLTAGHCSPRITFVMWPDSLDNRP